MRKLRSLNIGGHKIKIIYKDKLFDEKNKKIELLGLADVDNLRIYIQNGLPESRFVEVMLHECLHVIASIYDLNMNERQINTLGVEVMKLIRSNKIDLLTKGE